MESIPNSTHKKLRVTGILYLLSLLIPTLNWVFVLSPFCSFERILEHEILFQFNIINQVISVLCMLMFGVFLYQILKQIINSLPFTVLIFIKQ